MTEQNNESRDKGSRRWGGRLAKGTLGVFLAGALVAAGLFVSFDLVAHGTKSNEFCTSCHTMASNFAEYQGTPHFQNRPGVQAGCSNCHVAAGGLPLLWDKIRASSDVAHHLLGTIGTPEKFEARREAMAQKVWAHMKKNDSRECRSCHNFANMDLLEQSDGARKFHAIAKQEAATCIDCHKGIAHFLPVVDGDGAGPAKLLEAARAVPDSASKLYAVLTTPLYLSADTTDGNQGRVMPSAQVERVGQEGERLKVRLNGWRQEGVDKIIYFAPGKRIMSASLSDESAKMVTTGQSETDAGTGQKWTAVSIEAFVEKDKFIDKPEMLWDYARRLMTANCASCHGEPGLGHFSANQWIGVIQSMKTRTSMGDEEERMLTQYSQKHGSDMVARK